MSAENYFAPADPNDYLSQANGYSPASRLPEYLFPRTIESMFYGDVVHLPPDPELLAADELGHVYINPNYLYYPKPAEHPNFGDGLYISILYAQFQAGTGVEHMSSGYIVDLRHLQPGDIRVIPEADEDELEFVLDKYYAVVGVIAKDEKGRSTYDSRYRDQTEQLAKTLANKVDLLARHRPIGRTTSGVSRTGLRRSMARRRPKDVIGDAVSRSGEAEKSS